MNRYQPPRSPWTFGVASVALMALTFALAIGVPTSLIPAVPDTRTIAASHRMATGATTVAVIPARIEVVGVKDTKVADRHSKPRG
jgi:hypothetical protein